MPNLKENLSESVVNNPLISVIIPVYNTESFLRDCLNSVVNQTYTNYEVILVDDGSTDQSGAICDEYALKDNRFIVIHQNNQGVTMARITGFENSHGDLISFIDSDDNVFSDYLETLAIPIIEDDADIVCCKYNRVRNNIVVFSDNRISGVFQGEDLRSFISNRFLIDYNTKGYGMFPGLITKLVKRCFVEDGLKQGKDLWYGEDMIAVLSILLRCNKMVSLHNKLYNYVEHENEAVKRYNIGLWENNIKLFQRLEPLCSENNISINVLRSRIWKTISITIDTMQMNGIDYMSFYNDMSVVRSHPYMVNFFKPWLIVKGYGIKGNVGYLLLKLKVYHLFWVFEKKNKYS